MHRTGKHSGDWKGKSAPAAAGPCTVELDADPTTFFRGRVILKLPKGVELVEQNPFFARVERNGIPSACGGSLNFAARYERQMQIVEGVLTRDETKALNALTDEIQGELAGT